MELLLWAGLLLLVLGWPLLFVIVSAIRRKAFGAPREEYALKEHAELMAVKDAQDVRTGGRGW